MFRNFKHQTNFRTTRLHYPASKYRTSDIGRTARLQNLLPPIITKYSKSQFDKVLPTFIDTLSNVSTDMSFDKTLSYIFTALQKDLTIEAACIPAEGSYTADQIDHKSVIVPDLEENRELLHQLFK